MAYQPFKLSAKEQIKLKNALTELNAIREDIERAMDAGVPNMEALIEVCDGKMACIENIKRVYMPSEK